MAAVFSAPVLSSILFDQVDNASDQEGLLIGQVVHTIKDTISDSQINNKQEITKLYVSAYHIIKREQDLDVKWPEVLKYSMKEHIHKNGHLSVVGWFHSRRNTSARLSLREKSFHLELLKNMPSERREDFYFLLFTPSLSTNKSTHSFDYSVFKLAKGGHKGQYEKVPVTVVNLGDTTHTLYKKETNLTVTPSLGIYGSVVNRYQSILFDEKGGCKKLTVMNELVTTLQSKLENLACEVAGSEDHLRALEDEIAQKKYALHQKIESRVKNELSLKSPSALSTVSKDVNINATDKEHLNQNEDHSKKESGGNHGAWSLKSSGEHGHRRSLEVPDKAIEGTFGCHSRKLSCEDKNMEISGCSSIEDLKEIDFTAKNVTSDSTIKTIPPEETVEAEKQPDIGFKEKISEDKFCVAPPSTNDSIDDAARKECISRPIDSDPFSFVQGLMTHGKQKTGSNKQASTNTSRVSTRNSAKKHENKCHNGKVDEKNALHVSGIATRSQTQEGGKPASHVCTDVVVSETSAASSKTDFIVGKKYSDFTSGDGSNQSSKLHENTCIKDEKLQPSSSPVF